MPSVVSTLKSALNWAQSSTVNLIVVVFLIFSNKLNKLDKMEEEEEFERL
ncbi:hypothetical protein HanIR_Chr01g0025971 [Helianthus annuus]|nr:hypothetical protein HanIR_Chr01g0025971 [Helianthus annuus]